MRDNAKTLKVFAYSGRENGLMVVCSTDEMRNLASKLMAASEQESDVSSKKEWPSQVVSYEPKIGPYIGENNWNLSFHIEGSVPSESVVPLHRSPYVANVFRIAKVGLAFIGLFTIVKEVWHVF